MVTTPSSISTTARAPDSARTGSSRENTGRGDAKSITKNTTMLKAHEPYRFATARSNAPKRHAVIEVTSSGNAVENPSIQVPTNDSPQPLTAANCLAESANTGATRKMIAVPAAKMKDADSAMRRSV